jgi:hypothetical protein
MSHERCAQYTPDFFSLQANYISDTNKQAARRAVPEDYFE